MRGLSDLVRSHLEQAPATSTDMAQTLGISQVHASVVLCRMHDRGEVAREKMVDESHVGRPAFRYRAL